MMLNIQLQCSFISSHKPKAQVSFLTYPSPAVFVVCMLTFHLKPYSYSFHLIFIKIGKYMYNNWANALQNCVP